MANKKGLLPSLQPLRVSRQPTIVTTKIKTMGLEDILEDVLFKSLQQSKSPGSMDVDSAEPVVATTKGGTPDILILTMERECRKSYTDPGDGLHFVGLLLAVFAAELVSAYWAQNALAIKTAEVDRGPARMISVLYSAESVAFVLSHPTETQRQTSEKVKQNWPQNGIAGEEDESKFIYIVSATVNISDDSESKYQLSIPLFSCPRRYSEISQEKDSEVKYIHDHFEESDLLPPLAIAAAGDTLEKAFEVFFTAFTPRDVSVSVSSPGLGNAFFAQQFARGYGDPVNWHTDSALLRNAKLELDSKESLASSKVIGIFGSTFYPNILFQQKNIIGMYTSLSKEHSILSRNADFFGAGIEYSTYETTTPVTAEPSETIPTPSSPSVPNVGPEQLTNLLNLPANISLYPFADRTTVPQTPNLPPESPSFFSPSFSRDLASSSISHDPRLHTVNIPFHLNIPTRSQSYPNTPGPQRSGPLSSSYSSISRSQTSLRNRRPMESAFANITPITAKELETLIADDSLLLIDIRAFSAFAKGRLANAINVCIPTVLLKRSSLSLTDISDSIVSRGDRGRFAGWKEAQGILLYDADSLRVKDSHPLVTLAAKFVEAGFERPTYGLIGGYASLVDAPSLIDTTPLTDIKSPTSNTRFFSPSVNSQRTGVDAATRLALECKESPLFTNNSRTKIPGAPAFFSNIRQNMDLHGGVGPLIPMNAPKVSLAIQSHLPQWMKKVAYTPDGPQLLARNWEGIELAEKQRLETVLTGTGMQGRFSISAAMERGEKNRYPNIWPFEWNRVRIPLAETGQNYFNGSHVKDINPGIGGRRYIATQAPLPGTFEDFWKVVWGEGVQVIVCLTASEEGGQIKCHPYWTQSTVGEMHITPIHETKVDLGFGQNLTVRTLMLQNRAEPFMSMREIVQLHYDQWPDFGTPAEPATILSLVEFLNDITSQREKGKSAPIVVHCSAGCGRTGTFCTVDSVIHQLEKTRDDGGEKDLILETVRGLREQRMSLVQTLRQYVLCYECVLHYLLDKVSISSEDSRMDIG